MVFKVFWEHIQSHESFKLLLVLALLGGFIITYGLVSLLVKERLYLTECLVATLFGIAIGPKALGIVVPEYWVAQEGQVQWLTHELARFLIALQLMAVGTAVPGAFAKEHWWSLGIFLLPIMTCMWITSTVVIRVCIPGLGWLGAGILGACLAPTDPVLASSVVKGKFATRYIPTHLQHLLSFESGANDGLGLPFLMLPLLLLINTVEQGGSVGKAVKEWFLHTWLYEIALAVAIGALVGFLARKALAYAESHHWVDRESFLVFSIALTMMVTGMVALLGSDDFLAVFAAGNAFAWDTQLLERTAGSHLSEILDMLFNIAFFIFFGATFPWAGLSRLPFWGLFKASLVVLVVRRLPWVMLLRRWIPVLRSRKEAFFAGWFGPMGVGAIFFALSARTRLNAYPFLLRLSVTNSDGQDETTVPLGDVCHWVICFFVFSSLIVHGITVPITNFHMKKRAKRKALRKDTLRAQLATIAEAAASSDRDDLLINNNGNIGGSKSVAGSGLIGLASPTSTFVTESQSLRENVSPVSSLHVLPTILNLNSTTIDNDYEGYETEGEKQKDNPELLPDDDLEANLRKVEDGDDEH